MATTPVAASTPSPSAHIHTPPTPRLGFADSWEPFSPRKSSRIANAKSAAAAAAAASSSSSNTSARTPSPSSATRRAARLLRSPRQTKQSIPAPTQTHQTRQSHQSHQTQQPRQPIAHKSATFSPAPTPRKKRTMPTAHFLGPEDDHKSKAANGEGSSQSRMAMSMGMLPTPAKTPSKKVHAASQNESNIAAIARNLFHTDVDQVMSSPSKTPSRKGKKYTGVSLESFAVVEEEDPISIFTDSQDRVPEVDISIDNPFFGGGAIAAPAVAEPPRRRSKRNHVAIPGEGKQSIEDATRREDGLVYVFRGKKIFRKFDESYALQEEDGLEGASSGKRLTRSSIKPRLLFPRSSTHSRQLAGTPERVLEDDEEAVTDIEDHNLEGASDDEGAEADADEPELEPKPKKPKPEKSAKSEKLQKPEQADVMATPTGCAGKAAAPNTPPNALSAPSAPSFAPDTPPVTVRATRSSHKVVTPEERAPVKAPVAKKRSPFDGWRQTKSTASSSTSHKRQADELGSAIPAAAPKRTRH